MVKPTLDSLQSFIRWWNVTYPIDRWWREKHKVPFNSARHRSITFIDMKLEYEEDVMYRELSKEQEKVTYTPGTGNWLQKRKFVPVTQSEVDDLFDKFNIDDMKMDENGNIAL